MVSSNIWPSTALLRDISLENVSDLELDLSRAPKVKSNGAVGLPIYDFPLVLTSNCISKSHRLGVIAIRNFFLTVTGPNFDPPPPPHTHTHARAPLPRGGIFQSQMFSSLGQREGFHPK